MAIKDEPEDTEMEFTEESETGDKEDEDFEGPLYD